MKVKIISAVVVLVALLPVASLASSTYEQSLKKARTPIQKEKVMKAELASRASIILSQQTTISNLRVEMSDLAYQIEKLKADNKNLSDSNIDKDREIQRLSNSKTERQLEIERCDKNWHKILNPGWDH